MDVLERANAFEIDLFSGRRRVGREAGGGIAIVTAHDQVDLRVFRCTGRSAVEGPVALRPSMLDVSPLTARLRLRGRRGAGLAAPTVMVPLGIRVYLAAAGHAAFSDWAAAIWSSRITYGTGVAKIGIVANRYADSVHAILAHQALVRLIYALCVHAILASQRRGQGALILVIYADSVHTSLASGALILVIFALDRVTVLNLCTGFVSSENAGSRAVGLRGHVGARAGTVHAILASIAVRPLVTRHTAGVQDYG